jgi:hypothetical protein
MKTNRVPVGTVLLALIALLSLAVVTLTSASGPGYSLHWWTVDGGGGTLKGGSYSLSGTAGQPDAGALTGGGYALSGGFWGVGAGPVEYSVYLPLVLRNHP